MKATIYGHWLINNGICYLCQLGSAGVSDSVLCRTLIKISAKYPIPFPMLCFLYYSINRAKPFVTDRHTHTDTCTYGIQTLLTHRHNRHIYTEIDTETQGQANSQDNLHAGTHSDSCKTEDRRYMGHEKKHSNLNSLAKWFQGGNVFISFFNVTLRHYWWLGVNH